MSDPKKIYLISLGCSRNLVDSEVLSGMLKKKGYLLSDSPEGSDAVIVNTCAFIRDAKEESLEIILELVEMKKRGSIQKLIVTGCLPQRYPEELASGIKEIDAMFGSSDFPGIAASLGEIFSGKKISKISPVPAFLYDDLYERSYLTPDHYAYVKIEEGCSNRCSYCVIPDLRGPLRSRTIDSVEAEARRILREKNLKELILVGQDTTAYGFDRSGKSELVSLMRRLAPVMSNGWIRLLYTHPAHFTEELIDLIGSTENICKYIDLPIQHISDRILSKMNRGVSSARIKELIGLIRKKIPGAVIRTSIIAGFPGETENEFRELMSFLKDVRFDRLGCFVYSREEGTPACGFEGQLPETLKRSRFDAVMALQQKISEENNDKMLGRTLKVLIDESGPGAGSSAGRSYMDAPEVDGLVFVSGEGIKTGEFFDVKITGCMEYDLEGVVA